ncbi:hypothetical protein GCM10010361_75790 [Streptomyces olivaceiscleroticus]|uniref:Uncharacterized protein n=1 Tax=Streptomyces olivaceiscleroticus TaxID=68245 RepID=A0ABN1BJN6_9ACTN
MRNLGPFWFGDAAHWCAPGGSHPASVTGHNRRGHVSMAAVEYAPKHRSWVRDVLVGITAGFGSNLMWVLAQAMVHRLG